MRRNSTEDETRTLERSLAAGWLDLSGQARLLNLYQRASGSVLGVHRLYHFLIAGLDVSEARAQALRIVHSAGFSHPDPEVVVLLTPYERRLAVFVAAMNDVELGYNLRRKRELGFPERTSDRWSESLQELMSTGWPLRVVHGDVVERAVGSTRVLSPSNHSGYEGRAGLEKALSEASDIEHDWGPMVLLQKRPWGRPDPEGHKEWFVENSLFFEPKRQSYVIRYLHFVGEHAVHSGYDNGVISLEYELESIVAPSIIAHGGRITSAPTTEVERESVLARFEIGLLHLIHEKGAMSSGLRGGNGVGWRDVRRTLDALLEGYTASQVAGGPSPQTDFYLIPTHAQTASWRGSRHWSDQETRHGFVLGVRPAGSDAITIGIGSNLLDRRQTAIRPDRVWPEFAPWPGKSAARLTRRLDAWAKISGEDKIEVDIQTARHWLATLRESYRGDHYP